MEFSQQSNGVSMNYATSAPATAGGQAQGPVRFSVLLVSLHLVSECTPKCTLIDTGSHVLVEHLTQCEDLQPTLLATPLLESSITFRC